MRSRRAPAVALIGANGHGLWHRRHLAPRHEAGRLRLAALCDVEPIAPAEGAPVPAETMLFSDHREMLARTRPDVVVICTPPHTHLRIATDCVRAGADVLLEKPPVLSLAEHRALSRSLAETGRSCQVGFQALGSAALGELLDAIHAGRLGTVTGVSAVASWQRSDGYYARSRWAGRRHLDGQRVVDGVLANPLAHAIMQSLAVVEGVAGRTRVSSVELEAFRTRDIEVEDTACLRARLEPGPPVVVAVTLCGEDFIAGEIIVHGTEDRAVLEYPTDRLALPGDPALRDVPGRVSLLDNLLHHRESPGEVPLIAPLDRTAAFTALLDAIMASSPPVPLGGDAVTVVGEGPGRRVIVRGINAIVRRAAESGKLFSELGVPWACNPTWTTMQTMDDITL
jgi:predicted dehydrogenase